MTPDNPWQFTIAISQPEAETLARGEVPALLQNAVIGLLVDVHETPPQAIETMQRRKRKGRAA